MLSIIRNLLSFQRVRGTMQREKMGTMMLLYVDIKMGKQIRTIDYLSFLPLSLSSFSHRFVTEAEFTAPGDFDCGLEIYWLFFSLSNFSRFF